MKKSFFFLHFTLLAIVSFSQTLTFRAGPSFSHVDWQNSKGDNDSYNETLVGLSAFLELGYLDYRYFDMGTGLGFVRKGGTGTLERSGTVSPEPYSETDLYIKFNYLSFNTVARAKLPVGKVFVPFVKAGPRVDYLLGFSESNSVIYQFQEFGEVNKISWGLVTGAGADLHLGRFRTGLVFEYFVNFNKIVDFTMWGVTNTVSDRTFLLNLVAGYKF